MMRNNRILSAAVAAALFLPASSVYAGGFGNVNFNDSTTAAADTTAPAGSVVASCSGVTSAVTDAKKAGTCTISPTFNFTSNTVVNVPEDGLIYATELFTGGVPKDGMPALPGGTDCDAASLSGPKAAVMYTISANKVSTDGEMTVSFTLTGANFAEDPKLGISDNGGDHTGTYTPLSTATDKTTAKFKVTTNGTTGTTMLQKNDQLMLQYRIKNATGLATEDGKVIMAIDVEGDAEREPVTIATSKTALEYSLRTQEEGKVQIDVTNDNKQFATNGEPPAYQENVPSTSEGKGAVICYIKINSLSDDAIATFDGDIVQCDGYSEFIFTSTKDNLELATTSKLEITGGQFAASDTSKVYIEAGGIGTDGKVDNPGNGPANDSGEPNDLAASTVDGSTATWNFTNDNMNSFGTADAKEMPIVMEVDGATEINIVEDVPLASLLLDFKQGNDSTDKWGIADISLDSECLLIKRNGMVCRVFNVPKAGAMDILNIRVTNDSAEAGELTMTLYGMDGAVLGEGVLATAEEFGPGKTIRFTSTNLATKLGDITWEKRGMLEINSTLSKIELMTLLRHNNPNVPLLTNLSTGARGYACEQ
jgi:hypothetical protein